MDKIPEPLPPREIGELKHDYAPLRKPQLDPTRLEEIKLHMHYLTKDEWEQMAHEIRGKAVVRLVNDNTLIALLKLWVKT